MTGKQAFSVIGVILLAWWGIFNFVPQCHKTAVMAKGADFVIKKDVILNFDDERIVKICNSRRDNGQFIKVKLIKDRIKIYGMVRGSDLRVINP